MRCFVYFLDSLIGDTLKLDVHYGNNLYLIYKSTGCPYCAGFVITTNDDEILFYMGSGYSTGINERYI